MIDNPVVITDTRDLLRVMQSTRRSLGWTMDDVDWRTGLGDRYYSKVETLLRPQLSQRHVERNYRRAPFKMTPMASEILQAMGLKLCVIPEGLARALDAQEITLNVSKPRPTLLIERLKQNVSAAEDLEDEARRMLAEARALRSSEAKLLREATTVARKIDEREAALAGVRAA
ncbi:MAG: hypothetical protein AAFQ90_10570 [Pseudomonadota bacterium]